MSQVTPPPGLVGEAAQYIYSAAPRPVPEIALVAAIGLIAGIVGRSYNISGTGLNQYALLLANTGTGKEAMNRGISRIIGALTDPTPGNPHFVPMAGTFVGPADMASGQGLLKALARRNPPCFVSLIGEFGLRFKQMADDRASTSDTSLLRAMLDLYNKSGHGEFIGETVYSDKQNNTAAIFAPAVTLIGESTPETFFNNLNEQMITNGLLPRFTIVEYTGPRPARNRDAEAARPDRGMMERLAKLTTHCLAANSVNQVINVGMRSDAETFLDELDAHADAQINGASDGITKELWNRAHIKAVKLAALIAVGCDHEQPVVNLDMAEWATAQINRDIHRLVSRFANGDVGEVAGNEGKQEQAVLRCIREYIFGEYQRFASYGVTEQMHKQGAFTQTYISQRVRNLAAFKDRIGETKAIERTLHNLALGAVIQQLPTEQTIGLFGTRARIYMVADLNLFQTMIRSP